MATELFTQLDKHHVGIICVTNENQDEPWLNFEAGVLAKQLNKPDESRVCPLLVEITENDVTGPLKLLQMVSLNEDGMLKLVQMVNKYSIQQPRSEELVRETFDIWWPKLQTELQKMKVPERPKKSGRETPEMLEEILSLVRSIDKAVNVPPFSFLSPSAIPSSVSFGVPQVRMTAIADTLASELKAKLASEIQKSDPKLAEAISTAQAELIDGKLSLKFSPTYLPSISEKAEYAGRPENVEILRTAAASLGIELRDSS